MDVEHERTARSSVAIDKDGDLLADGKARGRLRLQRQEVVIACELSSAAATVSNVQHGVIEGARVDGAEYVDGGRGRREKECSLA